MRYVNNMGDVYMSDDNSFSKKIIDDMDAQLQLDNNRAAVLIDRADKHITKNRALENLQDGLSPSQGASSEFMAVAGDFEDLYKQVETSLEDLIMHGTAETKTKAKEVFEVFGAGENGRFADVMYGAAGNIEGAQDVIDFLTMAASDDDQDWEMIQNEANKGYQSFLPDPDEGCSKPDPDHVDADSWASPEEP